jgi:hypothetical protein
MTEFFKNWPRFDGAEAWSKLSPEQQAEIGAITLELAVAQHGIDRHIGQTTNNDGRPFDAAEPLLFHALQDSVTTALGSIDPDLFDDDLEAPPLVPIPSLLGAVCRICRCSEHDPCDEGCGWAEPDLCTACVGRCS